MRKSCEVPLTLLAGIALAGAAGCNRSPVEVRNCIDAEHHIVPDRNCQTPSPTGGGGGGYLFVYGGSSGNRAGDTVIGGKSAPQAGAEVITGDEAIARGGFGRGGGGEGGEGGEGGGHVGSGE